MLDRRMFGKGGQYLPKEIMTPLVVQGGGDGSIDFFLTLKGTVQDPPTAGLDREPVPAVVNEGRGGLWGDGERRAAPSPGQRGARCLP